MFILRNSFLAAALTASIFLAAAHGIAQSAPAAKPAQSVAQKIAASKSLLDINTATAAQLKALPGMGDEYVRRIIAGRPYTAKNQLTTRGILPQPAYEQVRDRIIAHRPKPLVAGSIPVSRSRVFSSSFLSIANDLSESAVGSRLGLRLTSAAKAALILRLLRHG